MLAEFPSPGYFITSMPKAGTHLLACLVEQVTGTAPVSLKAKPGTEGADFIRYASVRNLVGHYRVKQVRQSDDLACLMSQRQVLVLVRDPRDACNSLLHHMLGSPAPVHQRIATRLRGLPYEHQIMAIATGVVGPAGQPLSPSLEGWCSGFTELQDTFPTALVVRYEDLVEPALIAPTVARLFAMRLPDALRAVERAIASPSRTKRRGGARSHQWRALYSGGLKDFFSERFGSTITRMGYSLVG